MSVMRRKRSSPVREAAYLAHEALGLAIGRLSVSNPVARIALVSGYTRAIREHVAGGAVRSDDGNARELAAAGELLAAAHGVHLEEPRKRRRRRRKSAR